MIDVVQNNSFSNMEDLLILDNMLLLLFLLLIIITSGPLGASGMFSSSSGKGS